MKRKSNRILVVGDLILDHYIGGKVSRLSPEAPVPIMNLEKERYLLGGAGNVVRNLCEFNCNVDLFSIIGNDDYQKIITHHLKEFNLSSEYIFPFEGRVTTVKTRVISGNHQFLRIDREQTNYLSDKDTENLIHQIESIIHKYEIVIISDYGKGLCSERFLEAIIKLCTDTNKLVLVDPKGSDYNKYRGVFVLTPNKKEAELATGVEIKNLDSLKLCLEKLLDTTKCNLPLITMGEEGIAILKNQKVIKFPALSKEVYDVTGAGDTVIASLAYCFLNNKSINEAIIFANTAASIVVGKQGSATVKLEEVNRSLNKISTSNKILFRDKEINSLVSSLKSVKATFTNGCFDILHVGHVTYLKEASKKGDVLIVGLNSDKSVRKLKGSKRPINNELARANMLASLEFVDYVIIFEEDTPLKLIKQLKPHYLIKGGDYAIQDIIGREFAKETITIPLVKGISTTNIIRKILE